MIKPSTIQGFRYLTTIGLGLAVAALPFSVKICHASLAIVIIGWIGQGHWSDKWKNIKENRVVTLFAVFFFLHLAGMLYTQDTAAGWFDIEKKVTLILLPIVFVSVHRIEPKHLMLIFLVFIGACIIGTIVCLIHSVKMIVTDAVADPLASSVFWIVNPHASKNWLAFSYSDLSSGVRMHPTYLSMYLIFCLILIYAIFRREFFQQSRGFQLSLIALCLYLGAFIIFLSTRITTIAFVALVFIGCYHLDVDDRKSLRRLYSLGIVVFFLLMVYINPVSRYRNYQELFWLSRQTKTTHTPKNLSADIRASLWWVGIRSATEMNIVTGAGTGDIDDVMKATGRKYGVYNILGSHDPHNQFIFTMLGLGLIGLISLIACLAVPALDAYHHKDFLYLAFISLFAFLCLTESVLELQKGIVFFSIFNSLLIFQCRHPLTWHSFTFENKPPLK